jgi:hypothetical protein
MTWILANDKQHPAAFDKLALVTNPLDSWHELS